MSLYPKLKSQKLQARKTKNSVQLSLINTLLGELDTDVKRSNPDPKPENYTDEIIIAKVKKFIKSMDETSKYKHDADLSPQEISVKNEEYEILNSFLPKQLTEKELRFIIDVNSGCDKKTLFSFLKAEYAGLYSGQLVNQLYSESTNK